MPETPFTCTAVLPNGGFSSGGKTPVRYPAFSVVHRGTNLVSVLTLATSLHAALNNSWNALPTLRGRLQAVNEPGDYFYGADGHIYTAVNGVFTTIRYT
jgi:hypothetical protein